MKMSLLEQSIFAGRLIEKCCLDDGAVAPVTWLRMTPEDVARLKQIEETLGLLSPHADAIRKIVTGR